MGRGEGRIVGSVLVRNEDVHVERVIRNVADFCDAIHVLDHLSDDGTWPILERLSRELPHVSAERSGDAADSHRQLERYAGTRTWVLAVDGDELHDRGRLTRLRAELLDGAYADVFRINGYALNCDALDFERRQASGWFSPPSREGARLFNMAAVESWGGCLERLHGGEPEFRSGFSWDSQRFFSHSTTWETTPFRMLHACFVRRSSRDGPDAARGRLSLAETGDFRRSRLRSLARRVRPARIGDARVAEYRRRGSNWKREWYALGPHVTVDATPFL